MAAAAITVTRYAARFTEDLPGLGPVVIDLADVDGQVTPEELELRVAEALEILASDLALTGEPAERASGPGHSGRLGLGAGLVDSGSVKPPPHDPPPSTTDTPTDPPALVDPPAPDPAPPVRPAASTPDDREISAPPGSCARHLLTALADLGGHYEGKATEFARTHWARSPGAAAPLLLKLADRGGLTIERTSPRTVKSMTLTPAGWEAIDREPVERPSIGDLGPMTTTPFDPDKARAAAGAAL